MHIYIAGDHAGVEYRKALQQFLQSQGYETENLGTDSEESVDYPDFGEKVATAVQKNPDAKGLIVCGTGIGISIAANKVSGIRAANCTSSYMAEMARKHNDANILALGARIVEIEEAKKIVEVFFSTDFEGGRHAKRVKKIMHLEA